MSVGGWSGTDLERRVAGLLAVAVMILLFTAAAATGAVGHRSRLLEAAAAGGSRLGSAVVLIQAGLPPVTTPPTRPPAPAPAAMPVRAAPTTVPATRPPRPSGLRPAALASASGYGCPAALAWLAAHAAPGFRFVCPGYAMGHQAMTCRNIPGVCPGDAVIIIAVPCPAAYENEAWNSLLSVGLASGRVDPFGACP